MNQDQNGRYNNDPVNYLFQILTIMRYNIQLVSTKSVMVCFLLAVLLLSESCRKESPLAESDLDENYFVIKDNPDDPVDHAIYQFYSSTGVASFYNDTISKKKMGDTSGVPVYAYMTLSLQYSPFYSGKYYPFKRLTSKAQITPVLDLLKTDVLHRLPEGYSIPSIFFLDTFQFKPYATFNIKITDGWISVAGFNTVGIDVLDVESMTAEEKKMYAAAILAGIAEKKMYQLFTGRLQKDFFSVSRTKANPTLPTDIYNIFPLYLLYPSMNFPRPEELGFLRYHEVDLFGTRPPLANLLTAPNETEDLRIYLTHVLCYSEQELNEKYSTDVLVLKKLSLIREMLREAGFKLPG